MPYKSIKDANPAIRGIKPKVTLAQANLIAKWADAIPEDDDGAKSPWAVAIAQFYKLYKKEGGGWVKKAPASQELLFTINRTVARMARGDYKQIGGIEYLVAPIIAIKEGVLNDELVLEEEIAKYPQAWDGRPFVVGHPKDEQGQDVTANDPARLAERAIGYFFRSEIKDGKLHGQVWVDIAKAQRLGGDAAIVLARLRDGVPLEVSTAYFRDLDETPGTYQGQGYVGIARNLRPDHVAALLGTEGACSWADGCGVPRVNQDKNVDREKMGILRRALETIANALNLNGGKKVKYVETIVKDGRLELKTEQFEGVNEDILKALVAFMEKHPAENPEDKAKAEKLAAEKVKADALKAEELKAEKAKADKLKADKAKVEGPDICELDKVFSDLGGVEGVKALLGGLKQEAGEQKIELLAKLKANALCAFSEDRLKAMELEDLEALHRSLSPADYRGRFGGPAPSTDKAEALKMPSLWEKKEAK